MGDQNQRGSASGLAREQEIDDLGTGRLVEIAGRLVGDQDRWVRGPRPGESDALLLAARQFGRIVPAPIRQADRRELLAGALSGIIGARQLEGNGDVFDGPSWSG